MIFLRTTIAAAFALLLFSVVGAQAQYGKVQAPWYQQGKIAAGVSVTTSSTATQMPSAGLIAAICNTGASDAYLAFGTDNTVTATVSGSTWLRPGKCGTYDLNPFTTRFTWMAAIGNGATTLTVETGIGMPPSAALGPIVPLDPNAHDWTGDSRTRDIFPVTCTGGINLCGTRGTNWFVIANALAGQRWQIGLVQAIIGARSDQYMAQSNIAPMLASNSGWFDIGYPGINDMTPLNGSNYVNTNGVTVTPSNVSNVVTANILTGVQQAVAVGKSVIITNEPGNPSITNTSIGVSSFTGSIAAPGVVTVTSMASGTIYTPQTVTPVNGVLTSTPGSQLLVGSGVSTGTRFLAQLTGTGGAACPAPQPHGTPMPTSTCTGGVGTYSINNSLTISSQAMTGRYMLISAQFDLYYSLRAIADAYKGQVFFINNNPALHNFTGSATADTFKPNILLDGNGTTTGTHFNALGGYYGAQSFLSQFLTITPGTDLSTWSINDVSTANARSYITNALFTGAATGGTNSTCTLGSGTVPIGWQTACGVATTSLAISAPTTDTNLLYGNSAVPLGGNQLTIAVTAGAADTLRIFSAAPANTLWDVSEPIQGNMIVNIASGSSKCRVYSGVDIATDAGTRQVFANNSADDVASNGGATDGPTTAYTFQLQTIPSSALPASVTKSFIRYPVYVVFSAAGNCTVTISRPSLERVRTYNPVTNMFSGWLLWRDIQPGNDNSPAWMPKAA